MEIELLYSVLVTVDTFNHDLTTRTYLVAHSWMPMHSISTLSVSIFWAGHVGNQCAS
jgi:hypothetical protein